MWFLFSSKARTKTSHRRPRQPRASRLVLEPLEDRCLLSAPALGYSSYLPGPAYATAVDSSGDAYVAGISGGNSYVCKVNPTGTALDYDFTLPGTVALSIAVDGAGDAYVMGSTGSGFATTANAAFPQSSAAHNDFLAVLDPTGTELLYSTYLPNGTISSIPGGPWHGRPGSVAVDSSGNAYVTGEALAGFPTTANAFQTTLAGSCNAFVTEINPHLSGSASLVYSTYLGGSSSDWGTGVAVDGAGNVYVAGDTTSSNFPTTAGAFQRSYGGSSGTIGENGFGDAFVAKLNPALSGSASLVYSTYLGGSGYDGFVDYRGPNGLAIGGSPQKDGPAIAVDSAGDAYVAGTTTSTNFPTTPGAFQTTYHAGTTGTKKHPGVPNTGDAFVTKLNPTGSALIYSTYLGGSSLDGAMGIALDAQGNAYVTGYTHSTDFPVVNPVQSQKASGNDGMGNPNTDVFVSTLNATGSALLFSTYLGGSEDDCGNGIAVSSANDVYVAGGFLQATTNFPTTPGAFQTTPGSGFVFMIDPPVAVSPSSAAASPADNNVVHALLQTAHHANEA